MEEIQMAAAIIAFAGLALAWCAPHLLLFIGGVVLIFFGAVSGALSPQPMHLLVFGFGAFMLCAAPVVHAALGHIARSRVTAPSAAEPIATEPASPPRQRQTSDDYFRRLQSTRPIGTPD
ncbi:hypothetical protein [Aurantimonas sp. 22II-16-19i]|uniref:hypothetical protein n=1 Tax=Aurantimonas sp. 22II-16-19i TaxID=1317114 RepID=UPI0009F7F070|nr:hypothetical protein [Aurantimonas sp. 22II-16-19i]ORE87740.1 hypothetical protein ATO4_25338 [Aurantimonas sp. 22II-16-19i]